MRITELSNLEKVSFLVVKFNSSAVIDMDNNLYFWGDYFDGFKIKRPELMHNFRNRLLDISFGFKHALVLLEGG